MDEYPLIPLLPHLSHSSPDGARSIMSRGEEGGEEAGILKPEATGGGESTPDPSEALSDDDADKKKDDSAAKQMLLKAVDRFVEESQEIRKNIIVVHASGEQVEQVKQAHTSGGAWKC